MDSHSSYPTANFTEEELDSIRNIVMAWINEGFTIPPYLDVQYSIFEKLNINEDAVKEEGYYLQYDVSRPSPTTVNDPTIPDTDAHVVILPTKEMKEKYPRSR